jgi:DNA gyrase/topoisomerase IV subunit A
LEKSNVIVYTRKGNYAFISLKELDPSGKDNQGYSSIVLEENDGCAGYGVVNSNDDYILIITNKGGMKKTEIQFMGGAGRRKINSSYLATLEKDEEICYACGINKSSKINVVTRNGMFSYTKDDIPTLSRKDKCRKMLNLGYGNILSVEVRYSIV